MNKRLIKDWRCEEGMEMFIQNIHGYVHVFPGDRLAMTHKNNLKKEIRWAIWIRQMVSFLLRLENNT